MKYIIFEDNITGLKEPVIFGDHTVHSSVTVERAHPISAGFFVIEKGGIISTYDDAKSLGLTPAPDDAKLLEYVLQNMGTMFFLTI